MNKEPIEQDKEIITEETGGDKWGDALGEVIRKIALTGIGAYFVTEETIRQTLGEMKLPKEILAKVLANASKGKEELVKAFAKEFKGFLQAADLQGEVERFLQKNDVNIEAKVTFSPKKKDS
ncbi:MAG: hypothetical protein A3F16_01670 [Deltaproteobacteria bacterium RIFCSPHIGHO2_12_FULL_43_9]|nr:MAG: hypothetical protein A3F16_01670 [Deltaproteobacteria bacterium RIFCSPHIGHO2_12_FULL_43_9]